MLGAALIDPHGIETIDEGNAAGLGLLGVATVFEEAKTVQRRQTHFNELTGAWAALSNALVAGYEIHHGQTALRAEMDDGTHPVMPHDLAWQNAQGNVLGVYLHGLFEDPAVLHALFGAIAPTLDSVFDGLADYIEQHFEPGVLQSLIA
jgi:adenosylcobyric acid synthase